MIGHLNTLQGANHLAEFPVVRVPINGLKPGFVEFSDLLVAWWGLLRLDRMDWCKQQKTKQQELCFHVSKAPRCVEQ